MIKYGAMEKTERHQIKRNEVLVLLTKGYDLILKYKREILYFFLAVLGVALIVWGIISYKNLREKHAGMLLSQALSEEQVNYDKLKILVKKYKGTLAGKEASLIVELKEGKEPQVLLQKIDNLIGKSKDRIILGILISNKVEILISQKKFKEAMDFLKEKKDLIPEDFYLFLSAKVLEKEGKIEEAKAQYQRIYNEFQESHLRWQAQQRMNVL